MSQRSAEERLIAAATDIGLRKSVMLLQEQFAKDLSEVLLKSPVENLATEMRRALGLDESPKAARVPRKRALRRGSTPNVSLREARIGVTRIHADGEFTVMHLPDGRTWRSRRKRDLVLRAKKAGFAISM